MESHFERRSTAGHPHAEHGEEVTRWTGQPRDAPAEVKGWLDRLQPKFREGERVDVVAVEVRRSHVVDVTAAVAGLPALVRVGGEGVLDAVPTAFVARALLIAMAVGALAAWSAAVWLAYSVRHPWFAVSNGSMVLVLVGGCLAVLGGLVAAEWCVPGLRMTRRVALASVTGAALFTQAGAAGSGAPTMDDAERALAAGDVDAAVSEAAACAELGIDTVRAGALLDRVSLAAVEREGDLLAAAKLAAGPFHDEALRTRARDSVRTRMVSQISADQSAGEWSSTEPLIAALPQQDRVLPAVVALLAAHALHRLEACIGRLDAECATAALADAEALGAPQDAVAAQRASADSAARAKAAPDWDVIRSRKEPLGRRAQACDSARAPVAFAAAAGTSAFRPTVGELEATCAQVVADTEAERLRAEAAAAANARREEQARVRAEERARRAEAAAAAAWARAPLVCADGTWSPSCVCGGSHRGCCSHHGGVAGCSR